MKKDGQIISQTLLSKDTYNALPQIIQKGIGKQTVETAAEDSVVISNENNAIQDNSILEEPSE